MASNTTDLKIAVEEVASWGRRLSITVPAERVQRTRGRVADRVAKGMRLPGFRKGKLPTQVIEKRFGSEIDQETIDRLVQEAYREALETEGITPINQGRVGDVQYDKDSDLVFRVELEVRPEFELARLNGFTASRPPADVGEEEVDSVLERLRDERGEWVPLEEGARPDNGDQALVKITALGEDDEANEEPRTYRIVLGEDQAIADVEAAILTLAEGESGDFTVSFPDDFPDEERRGQQQKLHIGVSETRKKVLPELNDELAQGIGDFESVEKLRERILKDLEDEAQDRAEANVRNQLVEQILAANSFDPAPSMIETYLDYMTGDGQARGEDAPERTPQEEQRLAQLREGLRPQAESGLKRMLVLEKIAEREGLRASQDEIDERVEEIATRNDRSASEVWIQLEKSGQLEVLEREITEEKVFEFLKSQNTVA
ncbi:MAG: trigger factor [Gemmatimonas sp.]|nr:trigger factor [Gemmatimonas sp.]